MSVMSYLDTSDVEKRLHEKTDAIVLKHNNEYTFNSLLVLQLFLLWIGPRVGSGWVGTQKPHKLTGRVTAFVGRVGSGLEIWAHVQLWANTVI